MGKILSDYRESIRNLPYQPNPKLRKIEERQRVYQRLLERHSKCAVLNHSWSVAKILDRVDASFPAERVDIPGDVDRQDHQI